MGRGSKIYKFMKKKYIAPEMEIVNIQSPVIMAGSPPGYGGEAGAPGMDFDDEDY